LGRRSVRAYEKKIPDRDILETIMDCAIHAPTAWHKEPWAIRVVSRAALLARLDDGCRKWLEMTQSAPDGSILYHAPLLVVVAGETASPAASVDCSLAAENAMLAAHSLGLGSCVIGSMSDFLNSSEGESHAQSLRIPPTHRAIVSFALGYPTRPNFIPGDRDGSRVTYLS
jgi:nitroreductase